MSYVLSNGATSALTYPYTLAMLRSDNPTVSFPAAPSDETLADWDVYAVTPTAVPSYDRLTQDLSELNPTSVDGVTWLQAWQVTDVSQQVADDRTAAAEAAAAAEAERLLKEVEQYYLGGLIEARGFSQEMVDYIAALENFTAISGYPKVEQMAWPTLPDAPIDLANTTLPVDVYTTSQVDTQISTAVATAVESTFSGDYNDLTNKPTIPGAPRLTINLETDAGNTTTTAKIANALTTIGTTNGYVLNLGFGEYREAGPIVFDGKWQLNVVGPASANTTAVTIKNGVTIQNSNGVRFNRVQVEGVSTINCRAGLGQQFERAQFMGNTTLGGTGGFMMFTDCEFGGDVTIPNTFAGVVYFIRCSFSKAAGVYSFNQSSAFQAIFLDCSGIPNAGIAKASFSGTITYKNNSQAFFLNGAPFSGSDATKLPLAGGTMTGPITLSGAPSANLHAATKLYVDTAVAGIVNSAPGALDTLNELAAALGNDENFASTVNTRLTSIEQSVATIPSIDGLATETYVNDAVALKADQATTYTKTETDAAIAAAGGGGGSTDKIWVTPNETTWKIEEISGGIEVNYAPPVAGQDLSLTISEGDSNGYNFTFLYPSWQFTDEMGQQALNGASYVDYNGSNYPIAGVNIQRDFEPGFDRVNLYNDNQAPTNTGDMFTLHLMATGAAEPWILPARDFPSENAEELRGFTVDYHAYSFDSGTIVGKITVAFDDNPRITHQYVTSGASDTACVRLDVWDLEYDGDDWSYNKALFFTRTDGESDRLFIQWSGKAFYSPEFYN